MSAESAGHVLRIDNSNGFLLDNVKFIYGDSETRATSQSQDAGVSTKYRGLFVVGCRDFTIRDCQFTGNGSGSHLYVNQGERFNIDGCKVYD